VAARFFCDNCGEEVERNAVRCSRCGRYFASIRCPECGFTGDEKRFAKGCPVCGYCDDKREPARFPQAQTELSVTKPEKLPRWVYVVSAIGLIIVGLILFYRMR